MEYITQIIEIIGGLLTGGIFVSWYKAKPERTSIEIENLKSVIETMKEADSDHRAENKAEISELRSEVRSLQVTVENDKKAIYSAYDCPFPHKASDCIVLRNYRNNNTPNNDTDENTTPCDNAECEDGCGHLSAVPE